MSYEAFVSGKLQRLPPVGIAGARVNSPHLFDFQRALTEWALRRGRAALFCSTGLGKTRMELAWCDAVSRHTGRPALILAPLAVAAQTALEGAAIGIPVTVCRDGADVRDGINVANYERLHRFDAERFGCVALDESSCAKDFNSKTLAQLKEAFARTPYRLSATATPSPNDYTELGTQAELLGICSRTEMLSEYFVHDGGETQNWRLKGHAREPFWRFVASWGALVRSPADLGYDASAYELPSLKTTFHLIEADDAIVRESGLLFALPVTGLMEQRAARRGSMAERVRRCAALIALEPTEPWVVWCELNDEQAALEKIFGADCASVYGSLDADEKERRLMQFVNGEKRILVSKASICGFGINMQRAARVAFVGISNSWESYHQAVRRCWRFGQKRPVRVHLFASELEGNVARNLQRKENDAHAMSVELSRETAAMVRSEVVGQERRTNTYVPPAIDLPMWMRGASA